MSTNAIMEPPTAGSLMFRPESFFVGVTRGEGLVRDAFGRVVRRYEVSTHGRRDTTYGAIHFQETYVFDDGEVDIWRWALTEGGGRCAFSETLAGSGIVGKHVGEDYLISFHRPVSRARSFATRTYHTRFTALGPTVALKTSRVSVFGAPVAHMIAYHQRLEDQSGAAAGARRT